MFKEVDYVCISDNYWLGKTKPCLTYGLRGICYFYLTIKCAKADLHSGLFGGAVPEAMTDLFQIMSKLVDRDGKILVPGKTFVSSDLNQKRMFKVFMILLMPSQKRNVPHMDQLISMLKNTETILVQTNSSNLTRFDTL